MRRYWIINAVILQVVFCVSNAENTRPIIGVLAQENTDWPGRGDTFIRSSYFKYVEQAGARAVPIKIKESDAYYEKMFKSINGLLLPGGGVDVESSGYAIAARKMFDMAIQANDNNDYFPIWGTCLGFEELSVLVGGKDVLSSVSGWNLSLPLNFRSNYKESKLYAYLTDTMYQYVTRHDVAQNMHRYGVLTKTFAGNTKLRNFFDVLTTNTDSNGLEYVSSMEGKKYPFYAVQFHPEKNIYEWDLKVNVNHEVTAVGFAQYLADVFIQEARKSQHQFSTIEEEASALINNYQTTYLGEPSFMTIYFFNYNETDDTQSSVGVDWTRGYNLSIYTAAEVNVLRPEYANQLNCMLLLIGLVLVLVVVSRAYRLAILRARLVKYTNADQTDESINMTEKQNPTEQYTIKK